MKELEIEEEKMKKLLTCLTVLSLLGTVLVGCQTTEPAKPSQTAAPTQGTTQPQTTSTQPTANRPETYVFKDSTGREVELPTQIDRIAPSGTLAQILLQAVAPEKLVGWAKKPGEKSLNYLPQDLQNLPEFGQFYGKKSNLNLEAVIQAKPQVVIDLGDQKKSHKEDMDGIQKQTQIPTIFIQATLDNFPEAIRTLGKVLKVETRAETLAQFAEDTLKMAQEKSAALPESARKTVYFGTGKLGLDGNARGSIHEQVLQKIGATNALVVEKVSNKGGGNPIDREQLLKMDPDAIILAGPAYEAIQADGSWNDLRAVSEGHFYQIPDEPYSFLSGPPSINQLAGIYWLGQTLYPEVYQYDLVEKIQTFYRLFYHYELTEAQAKALMNLK